MENDIVWSETGSGFRETGGHTPTKKSQNKHWANLPRMTLESGDNQVTHQRTSQFSTLMLSHCCILFATKLIRDH